jgi:anti-sigma factor RsiW
MTNVARNIVQLKSLRSWLKSLMFKYIHGMISCRDFEDFIQAYIDGELALKQRAVFERHIWFCRECRGYLAAYKRAIEIGESVLKAKDEALSSDIPEDLIKAILASRKL